jgi:HTH-type transcriptional regulator/antitoxin HigA
LRDNGIVLVVADHLPKTKVDGVVILDDYRKPIIGLSLRFDRLDNFWFTLLHELAHIALHQKKESIYFDELEDSLGVSINDDEHEADELAEEAIVPFSKWEISPAKITPSSMAAESLAEEMGIGVAVAAGYIRHKNQNYFYLRKIVNSDRARVRGLFDSQLRMEGAK